MKMDDDVTTTMASPSPCEVTPATEPPPHAEFYELSRLVTGLVIYPVICVVGLVGNCLALVVFSRPTMITSYNVLLAVMAANDLVKLLNDLLYFVHVVLLVTDRPAADRLFVHVYPASHYIFNQTACVTAWLTVSVAVERYIFVCHATKARLVCTVRRAVIIGLCVVVSMSVVALPSALRYRRTACLNTATNQTVYEVQLTEFGRAQPSAAIYTWTLTLLRSILPLIVLVAFNARIVYSLRTVGIPAGDGDDGRQRRRSAKNRSVTVMLVVVVIVFVVCILPDAVMSVGFRVGYVDERDQLAKGAREFSDALLALCSAVNFVVYCLCGSQFRAALFDVFNYRRPRVEL